MTRLTPKQMEWLKEKFTECLTETAIDYLTDGLIEGLLESKDTSKIAVKHENVLGLKKGGFMKFTAGAAIRKAKKSKTKAFVMKALVNLERWNKKGNPKVAKHARSIINQLKKSKEWNELETKKEPKKIEKKAPAKKNTPKKDGSGKGTRANQGRGGCKTTKKTGQGKK